MLTTIECAGHPRDMGLAQGAASKAAIREEAARLGLPMNRSRRPSLGALAIGTVRGAGAGREMFRHFAHLAERLEGVAKEADLPLDTVLAIHLRVRAGGAQAGVLSRRSTLRARSTASSSDAKRWCLERSLPRASATEAGWIVRDSRPAVGFRSVEVTLPWLVSSVAGLNEGGLAVVAGPLLWGSPGRDGNPTSLLLVQECLQRFPDLEGALDWCSKRPVEGEQSILLADTSGALATVVVSGRERRIQLGEGELHLEGGEPPEPSSGAVSAGAGEDRIWIDPCAGRLQLHVGGADLEIELPRTKEAASEEG